MRRASSPSELTPDPSRVAQYGPGTRARQYLRNDAAKALAAFRGRREELLTRLRSLTMLVAHAGLAPGVR